MDAKQYKVAAYEAAQETLTKVFQRKISCLGRARAARPCPKCKLPLQVDETIFSYGPYYNSWIWVCGHCAMESPFDMPHVRALLHSHPEAAKLVEAELNQRLSPPVLAIPNGQSRQPEPITPKPAPPVTDLDGCTSLWPISCSKATCCGYCWGGGVNEECYVGADCEDCRGRDGACCGSCEKCEGEALSWTEYCGYCETGFYIGEQCASDDSHQMAAAMQVMNEARQRQRQAEEDYSKAKQWYERYEKCLARH
jgi:hypothetical protein